MNEYDYKHAPLRCIRYEVRLATEELDRLGVEKFEDGDGTAWSLMKRIRLLAEENERLLDLLVWFVSLEDGHPEHTRALEKAEEVLKAHNRLPVLDRGEPT